MGRRTTPSLMTHTLQEIAEFWRQLPCPKCHAPSGAPCADFRSYDGNLYVVSVHKPRERLVRALCRV